MASDSRLVFLIKKISQNDTSEIQVLLVITVLNSTFFSSWINFQGSTNWEIEAKCCRKSPPSLPNWPRQFDIQTTLSDLKVPDRIFFLSNKNTVEVRREYQQFISHYLHKRNRFSPQFTPMLFNANNNSLFRTFHILWMDGCMDFMSP